MRRVVSLAVFLLIAAASPAAFAGGVLQKDPVFSGGGFPTAAMYITPFWFASIRSSMQYAMADFQQGDVVVETGDADAPYLRLHFEIMLTCGGPWSPIGDAWIAEIHDTKASAEARAAWFQWKSQIVEAPNGQWLLVYRNPDVR